MQGRPPEQSQEETPAATSEEVGNINEVRAYSIVDAIRVSLEVGILGYGTTGTISRDNSLITAITAEGVASTFSLIIAIHEFWRVLAEVCCRRDGRTVASTNRSPTEYSLYLCFRVMCVAMSYTGVALVASDIANNSTSLKTTVGLGLIALSIFSSRALSGSKHKQTNPVFYSDDQLMEMGMRKAQQKALRRGQPYKQVSSAAPVHADEEMLPVAEPHTERSTGFSRQVMRPNAHYQQQAQTHQKASGFSNEFDVPLTTDAAEKIKSQQTAAPPPSTSPVVTTAMPAGTMLWAAGQPVEPVQDLSNKQKQEATSAGMGLGNTKE